MATVLTTAASVFCFHEGVQGTGLVILAPTQQRLTAEGGPVLVGDLTGTDIFGCTLTGPPGTVPCKKIKDMAAGEAARLTVDGGAVLLDTANGATDSTPPGTWKVIDPGQTRLTAD